MCFVADLAQNKSSVFSRARPVVKRSFQNKRNVHIFLLGKGPSNKI